MLFLLTKNWYFVIKKMVKQISGIILQIRYEWKTIHTQSEELRKILYYVILVNWSLSCVSFNNNGRKEKLHYLLHCGKQVVSTFFTLFHYVNRFLQLFGIRARRGNAFLGGLLNFPRYNSTILLYRHKTGDYMYTENAPLNRGELICDTKSARINPIIKVV